MDDFTWLLPRDDNDKGFTWWLVSSTLAHLCVLLISSLVVPSWPDVSEQYVTWATLVNDSGETAQEETAPPEPLPVKPREITGATPRKSPPSVSAATATTQEPPAGAQSVPEPPLPPKPATDEGVRLVAEKTTPAAATPPKQLQEQPVEKVARIEPPVPRPSPAPAVTTAPQQPPVQKRLSSAVPASPPAAPPRTVVPRKLPTPSPTVTYSRQVQPTITTAQPPRQQPLRTAVNVRPVSSIMPSSPGQGHERPPAKPAAPTPSPSAAVTPAPARPAPSPPKPAPLSSLVQAAIPAPAPPLEAPKAAPAPQPEVQPPPPQKPPPVISVPSGEIKLELTAADDLPREMRVVVHFRPYAKRLHSRPMTRAEASQSKVLVPQMVRPKATTLTAVLETAAEGVYDFRIEGWRGDSGPQVVCTLFENSAGSKTKRLGNRTPAANGSIARLLMPEGIFWDDEHAFQGSMESSDSVTRFNSSTGLVWREYR